MKELLKKYIPEETRIRWVRRHRQGIELHGWRHYWLSEWCRVQFVRNRLDFSKFSHLPQEGHPVHVTCNLSYLPMARFMLYTLYQNSGRRWPVRIFPLAASEFPEMTRAFSEAKSIEVVSPEECRERRERHFPRENYPVLREVLETSPVFGKQVDALPGYGPYVHVLDSDMIFFGYPDEMIEYDRNRQSYYQTEREFTHYNLPFEELKRRTDAPLLPSVNTGYIGYRADEIDWERVESILEKIWPGSITPHLVEQTIGGYLMARCSPEVLTPSKFFVAMFPGEATPARQHPDVRMMHYAHQSRADLYLHAMDHVKVSTDTGA